MAEITGFQRDQLRIRELMQHEVALRARIATLEAALRTGLETCELAKDMTFAPWATYAKKLLDGGALRGEGEKP